MNKIIISDSYAKLTKEIQGLKQVLAALTEERDDLLYHICPELAARYARNVGDYVNRINYQKITILEMKRRIELARAALNREKAVSQESVDEQINTEYRQFRDKADEEFCKSEEAKRWQDEREKRQQQYERRWQQQYGRRNRGSNAADAFNSAGADDAANSESSDDFSEGSGTQSNAGPGSTGSCNKADSISDSPAAIEEENCPNAKEMFRKIVKKLHPDMNPDITKREKELFNKAVKAYQEGDIATLQEIYDEVFCAGETDINGKELTLEELSEIKHKLEVRIAELQAEINNIKNDFPYREKDLLEDPEKLDELTREMNEIIRKNEETIRHLNEMLIEINNEMEQLRKKQGSCDS